MDRFQHLAGAVLLTSAVLLELLPLGLLAALEDGDAVVAVHLGDELEPDVFRADSLA